MISKLVASARLGIGIVRGIVYNGQTASQSVEGKEGSGMLSGECWLYDNARVCDRDVAVASNWPSAQQQHGWCCRGSLQSLLAPEVAGMAQWRCCLCL